MISLPLLSGDVSPDEVLDVMKMTGRNAVVIDLHGAQRLLRFEKLNVNVGLGELDIYEATEALTFPLSLTEAPEVGVTKIILDIPSHLFMGGPAICRCSAGHAAFPSEKGRPCRRNDGGTVQC